MNELNETLAKLSHGVHCTIVALGDSNTQITFHTQGRMNWTGLLAEGIFNKYGHGICTLINAGKCGSTFAEARTRLERDVIRLRPDLVIVSLGLNDAGASFDGLDLFRHEVRGTIQQIIQSTACEILIRTPNPICVVNGLPHLYNDTPGTPIELTQRPVGAYAAALVEVAGQMGCPVVDHYRSWTEQEFHVDHAAANPNRLWPRMSDAIHPNGIGHLMFYRELAPWFGLSRYFAWEMIDESVK